MLAVAQTMSTLSKNQVVALVLSVVVNLLFFLSGIEYVLGFYRSFLPYELVENIADLSFLTQFMNMANGVVALSGILFFISTICSHFNRYVVHLIVALVCISLMSNDILYTYLPFVHH